MMTPTGLHAHSSADLVGGSTLSSHVLLLHRGSVYDVRRGVMKKRGTSQT